VQAPEELTDILRGFGRSVVIRQCRVRRRRPTTRRATTPTTTPTTDVDYMYGTVLDEA
jgi:hypothetical protein